MKRANHLMNKVLDMHNLVEAFAQARRSAGWNRASMAYAHNLYDNLNELQGQLASGHIKVGGYNYFTIFDPKKRQICAAPFEQRVLHHALLGPCHDVFERRQVYHSYATRKGKGTHAAIKHAAGCAARNTWFLKLDVKKFFDSLDHHVLGTQVKNMFKEQHLQQIFEKITGSYEAYPNRGVPIGNLTSQYLSNNYLVPLDNLILQEIKPAGYIRYMDDMLLFADNKEFLKSAVRQIEAYLHHELALALKPIVLNSVSQGVPFLGFLLYPNKIRLAARSRHRFARKFEHKARELDAGCISQEAFGVQLCCMVNFINTADSYGFRNFVFADHSKATAKRL